MTTIIGIVGAAVLFGLFTLLRPRDRDRDCTNRCIGCIGDGACKRTGVER